MSILIWIVEMKPLKPVKTFGECVTQMRKRAGLSKEELARRVGLSTIYIDNLERGIDPTGKTKVLSPPGEVVDNIAKALGWSLPEARRAAGYELPDDLSSQLPYKQEKEFEESDFASLYAKYQALTTEQQKAFQPVLEMVFRELDYLLKAQEEIDRFNLGETREHKGNNFQIITGIVGENTQKS